LQPKLDLLPSRFLGHFVKGLIQASNQDGSMTAARASGGSVKASRSSSAVCLSTHRFHPVPAFRFALAVPTLIAAGFTVTSAVRILREHAELRPHRDERL
jgi:hypothetical protein